MCGSVCVCVVGGGSLGNSWWELGFLPDVTGPWNALLQQMHVSQASGAVYLGGRLTQLLAQPVLGRIEMMCIRLPNLRLILAGRTTRIPIGDNNNGGQNGAEGKDCNQIGYGLYFLYKGKSIVRTGFHGV